MPQKAWDPEVRGDPLEISGWWVGGPGRQRGRGGGRGPAPPPVATPSCQPYCLLTTRGQPPGHQPRVAVGTVPGETRSKLVPKQNSPAGPSVPGAPAALRVHRRPGTERVVIRVAARRRCRHKSDVDQSSPSHPRHQRTRARSASSPTASHSTTRTPAVPAHGRTPSPKPPPPGPRGCPPLPGGGGEGSAEGTPPGGRSGKAPPRHLRW